MNPMAAIAMIGAGAAASVAAGAAALAHRQHDDTDDDDNDDDDDSDNDDDDDLDGSSMVSGAGFGGFWGTPADEADRQRMPSVTPASTDAALAASTDGGEGPRSESIVSAAGGAAENTRGHGGVAEETEAGVVAAVGDAHSSSHTDAVAEGLPHVGTGPQYTVEGARRRKVFETSLPVYVVMRLGESEATSSIVYRFVCVTLPLHLCMCHIAPCSALGGVIPSFHLCMCHIAPSFWYVSHNFFSSVIRLTHACTTKSYWGDRG